MNRRSFMAALAAFSQRTPLGLNLGSEPVLVRFPYLQNVRTNGATIMWGTEGSDAASVEFSSDGRNFAKVSGAAKRYPSEETQPMPPFTQYRADLKDLTPNSAYSYRVSSGGTTIAHGRFRTAGPGPFVFHVMGDSGQRSAAQAAIAREIAAEGPAFLLHVGDLAYFHGSHNEFQLNHFDVYNFLLNTVPFFPAPGNHEYETDNARPYLSVHAPPNEGVPQEDSGRYYSFDWGNAHFVSLDSNASLQRAARGQGDMLRWLENDLRQTRQFWRIAMIHHPPFATGPNEGDPSSILVREHVSPILEAHGVNLVLSGHEHSYQRTHPLRSGFRAAANTGAVYVTTGGGGAFLYPALSNALTAAARSENHYLRVQVNGSVLQIAAIAPPGPAFDTFSLAPLPTLASTASAVTLTPAATGYLVTIRGLFFAPEEVFSAGAPVRQLGGLNVAINGQPIILEYVSPTEIRGLLEAPVNASFQLRITTANGILERSIP